MSIPDEPDITHDPTDDDDSARWECSVCRQDVDGPNLFRFALSKGHHDCLVRLRAADRLARAALYGDGVTVAMTDLDAIIRGDVALVAQPVIEGEIMAHFHVAPHNPDVLHRGPVDACEWCTQPGEPVEPAAYSSHHAAMGHRPTITAPLGDLEEMVRHQDRLDELWRAEVQHKLYPAGDPVIEDPVIEDPELAAIETIVGVLTPLPYSTRVRVMTYLKSRFG